MAEKKKDEKVSGVVEKTVTEHLECKFTEKELKELSGDLARYVKELSASELKKKEVMSSLTAEINALESKVQSYAHKVSTGTEYRDVKCNVTYDFNAGTIRVHRNDTEEMIKDREMTDEQKQQSFLDSLTDN